MNVSRLSLAVIFSIILFSGTTSVALAQIGNGPTTILGDFKCYLPDPDIIGPPVDPVANIGLEDQFRTLKDVDVFDRKLFCGNVIKNIDGLAPEFPDQHYWTYDIVVNDVLSQECFDVIVEDQFMKTTHSVCGPPDELWVPAEKTNFNSEEPTFPIVKDTHYLCYVIDGDSADERALLFDQFTDGTQQGFEDVMVLEPTHLCNPVLKTTADGSVFGEQIDEHLKCYDIVNDNAEPGAEHDSIANINIQLIDQFSPPDVEPIPFSDDVTSDTFVKLCVVATKTLPLPPDDGPVGGEFLPIDSTALVLAGLQTSAIWMLPVLAGAAGVGAYYIRTRMNKA